MNQYCSCFNKFSWSQFKFIKDLKKGLLKVMDKMYEPLIYAFLTDKNVYDAERIYESLFVFHKKKCYIYSKSYKCRNFFKNLGTK